MQYRAPGTRGLALEVLARRLHDRTHKTQDAPRDKGRNAATTKADYRVLKGKNYRLVDVKACSLQKICMMDRGGKFRLRFRLHKTKGGKDCDTFRAVLFDPVILVFTNHGSFRFVSFRFVSLDCGIVSFRWIVEF